MKHQFLCPAPVISAIIISVSISNKQIVWFHLKFSCYAGAMMYKEFFTVATL